MTNNELAVRHRLDPLKKKDFIEAQEHNPMPIMFVYISPKSMPDGRDAGTPENPQPPKRIVERVEKWGQVQKYLPRWEADLSSSPGVLVAVYGTPSDRVTIAAMMIERSNWKNSIGELGVCVPTSSSQDVDAFKLRGRRIEKAAGIRFDRDPTRHFAFLNTDLTLSGEQYPVRRG